ncbi:MAG: DUF86 domain-containing protein [Kiritimatiellales bacterium]
MHIQPDDVLLNKASIIERCVHRIKQEHNACPQLDDFTCVDALTLNIQRACEAAIDMAMHLAAKHHLGIPQSKAESFNLLKNAGIIFDELCRKMRGMTGFRNIAVHQYQQLDIGILKYIAETGCLDFVEFCKALGLKIVI